MQRETHAAIFNWGELDDMSSTTLEILVYDTGNYADVVRAGNHNAVYRDTVQDRRDFLPAIQGCAVVAVCTGRTDLSVVLIDGGKVIFEADVMSAPQLWGELEDQRLRELALLELEKGTKHGT